MTPDDLRRIAEHVCDRRPEWTLGEVLTVLHRVMTSRPGMTPERLAIAASEVAGTPAARTPWALLGAGGQWSEAAGRPVLPAPPGVREVLGHTAGGDPDTYRTGVAIARDGLREAAARREAEGRARRARDEAQRVERALADTERTALGQSPNAPDVFGGDDPW